MSRLLDPSALRALARGCAILGAGGGGDPHLGLLQALQATEEHGPVPLVDLDELADDALIMPCGGIGAPTVGLEKFGNGDEGGRLRDHLEQLTGRRVAALMSSEIGGSNGLHPVAWAARTGLPVLDADGMGRAFPEVPQVSMQVAGISPSPCVMTDERGNVIVFRAVSGRWLERLARAAAVEMGGRAASTEYVLTVAEARQATLRGSVSLAMRIGQAAVGAADPVAAVLAATGGFGLVTGKLTDVDRRTTGGFARGSVEVEGLGPDAGRVVRLEFQNENLVVVELGPAAGRRRGGDRGVVPPGQHNIRASVPDVITVLDSQTAGAIPTERLRYGQRVTVIAFGCHPLWRTAAGLALAGPRAFGYDVGYVPVEELAGLPC
jgi:uncharacterized protein